MVGEIRLTAHNRQGSKSHVSERGEDDFPKPRIKLIHPSGETRYFYLKDRTKEENPKFSVIIDGVKHYIGKGWYIDFIFSSALEGLQNFEPNEYNINVDTDVNRFGSLSGASKWRGGVLAPNGKIYGIPYSSDTVLEIDPRKNTTITFGSLSGAYKWYGGVLAPNGKIYGIPESSTTVLEIDPTNNTTITFGSLSGTMRWYGGVLAPNGKIYGIPYSSNTVLEIDPITNTTTTFGSLSGASKWTGGVLAPNGKIYGIPYSSNTVLEIDPTNNTTITFGSLDSSNFKWIGGVLAPNGKIYGIPCNSTTVLQFYTGELTSNGLLSPYFNKF